MRNVVLRLMLGLLVSSGAARADVYYLKDGGKIDGKGRDLGDSIEIQVPLGSITVPKSEIVRVVPAKSVLDLYEERLAATPRTAAGLYALALWCESAGLYRQMRAHLEEVLRLDPDYAEARQRLGFRKVGTRWLTDDEYHEQRGDIRFRGRWMPPDTVAALLQAEALQKKLAARPAPQVAGAQPAAGNAGATPAGNAPAGNAGGAPGGNPKQQGGQLALQGPIRPSQGFLDKYFVTNPLLVGSAGARIHWGAAQGADGVVRFGPVYHGPYAYDDEDDGLGLVWSGSRYLGWGSTGGLGLSGRAGTDVPADRSGLDFSYRIGKPTSKFFFAGNLHAGQTSGPGGSSESVGHSFFGQFRSGKNRVTFSFRP